MRAIEFRSYVQTHRPLIQVAFDLTRLTEALRVARSLILSAGSQPFIVEAGTPLIKSEGMRAVEALAAATDRPVVADTKTVDAGDVEADLVAAHGGSAFTVLASAPEPTLRRAVRRAKELGLAVIADLLGVQDPLSILERMNALEVDVVLLHVGVDLQRERGASALELLDFLEESRRVFAGFVAVAGGIRPREAATFAKSGADIVVIGSAIVRSSEPGRELTEALESLSSARSSASPRQR